MFSKTLDGTSGRRAAGSSNTRHAERWMALLAVLTVGLCPALAGAQTKISQTVWTSAVSGGGILAGGSPGGTSLGVNSLGNVVIGNTYGSDIYQYNGTTGAVTTLSSSFSNPGPVAIDAKDNLYLFGTYSSTIVKVPLVGGTYTVVASPTAACTGTDTVACTIAVSGGPGGYATAYFDAAGNLYVTSDSSGSANSLYKIPAAGFTADALTPALLYTESAAGTYFGGIAVDKFGDLFYTDSASNSNEDSTVSAVHELMASGTGTGFATTPVTIFTYTPATPSNYDDQVDAVAVDGTGTLYFGLENEGLFAVPNTGAAIITSQIYEVAPLSVKVLTTDYRGDFFAGGYVTSGDMVQKLTVGLVTVPSGSTTVSNAHTVLNNGACASDMPTFTVGSTTFTATAGTCAAAGVSGVAGAALYPTTVTFTAGTATTTQTATLTATPTTGAAGTATLVGVVGAVTQAATPTFNPVAGPVASGTQVMISTTTPDATIYYTTNGTAPVVSGTGSEIYTGPITVTASETIEAIAVAQNFSNSNVASAVYTVTGPAATPTFNPPAGSYGAAQMVTISDTSPGVTIYYTVNGTMPTTGSTQYTTPITVAATETLKAIAVGGAYTISPVATALYTIAAASFTNPADVISQVTLYGAYTGGGFLSGSNAGGNTPSILPNGSVAAGLTYGGDLEFITPAGVITTVAVGNASGTTVDPSGNLYVSTAYSSQMYKFPYVNGAYATSASPAVCTATSTTECTLPYFNLSTSYDVSDLGFDSAGDLFIATWGNGGAPVALLECNAACLVSAVGATPNLKPVVLYTETRAVPAGAASGANYFFGGIGVDSSGNLFVSESVSTSGLDSTTSYLEELPVSTVGTTGYGTALTTLYTYTTASPGGYDNQLDAVTVDANDYVYFATQNDGIFGFSNNKGVIGTTPFTLSTRGAKGMTNDKKGNFYVVAYNSATSTDDSVFQIATAAVTLPTTQENSTGTAAITTAINDAACSAGPTVTYTSTDPEFTAVTATGATCASTLVGDATLAGTVSFTPTATGTITATLTAKDSANGMGSTTVTGVATVEPTAATPTFNPPGGPYAAAQTVTISDATAGATIHYTVDGSTPSATHGTVYTTPITVSTTEMVNAIAVVANYQTSAVGTATYTISTPQTITFPQPTTPVQYGTAPVTLTATASSGLAVTYTVTGPATISGNVLTYTGAGTVMVTANQAGNATYAAAAPVTDTIVVNGGSAQAIVFAPLAGYSHTATPTIPLIGYATSHLALTYTATGPATVNANGTLTLTGAGAVSVTASQAGNTTFNAAAPVTRTFTAQ